MASQKAKGLATLIKLATRATEDAQRAVAAAVEVVEQAEQRLADHEAVMEREAEAASQNGFLSRAYVAWQPGAVDRRATLRQEVEIAKARLELARDQLADAFRERKSYEIAHQTVLDRERRERQRIENGKLDEAGLNGWFRRLNTADAF